MPKRATSELPIIDNKKIINIIDEYKELEVECDKVIEKIIKRQSKKNKKTAA